MGTYPPPAPFVVATDIEGTEWLDEALAPLGHGPPLVGGIVPSGFEAYARVLHPARRFFGPSIEQSVPLRWSEIAAARGKTVHPEMRLEALIDNVDGHDYEHWTAISAGGGEWFPPFEWLEADEGHELLSLLHSCTEASEHAWFLLWDGYGDLGPGITTAARAFIHPDRSGRPLPPELAGRTLAFRDYLVFRAPLDALVGWFLWRFEGPNYLWPADRAWIVATEIDGFSTYVGGSRPCIEKVLASPLLEALPSALDHRFDGWGDPINGPA